MENFNSTNIFISRLKTLLDSKSEYNYAPKLGVAQQSLNKYLKGETKPPIKLLINAATLFGVSTDWLLGLSEEPNQQRQSIGSSLGIRLEDVKRNAEQATASINALQTAIEKLNKTI